MFLLDYLRSALMQIMASLKGPGEAQIHDGKSLIVTVPLHPEEST